MLLRLAAAASRTSAAAAHGPRRAFPSLAPPSSTTSVHARAHARHGHATGLAPHTRGPAVRAAVAIATRALSTGGSGSGSLSSDSHSDFASEKKGPQTADDEEIQQFIAQAVKDHPVLLFMKGTPEAPRCGFSRQVAAVLEREGADFSSADVLSSEEVREGVKKFTNWPTIPQLFVGGEFVGGCDIVTDLHESGELKEMLSKVGAVKAKKQE